MTELGSGGGEEAGTDTILGDSPKEGVRLTSSSWAADPSEA